MDKRSSMRWKSGWAIRGSDDLLMDDLLWGRSWGDATAANPKGETKWEKKGGKEGSLKIQRVGKKFGDYENLSWGGGSQRGSRGEGKD